MLRPVILSACFIGTIGALSFVTACPPASTGEGEGEGEGSTGGEGEGSTGEGEGEGEGSTGGCGAVTSQGDCNGTKVEFCATNPQSGQQSVQTYDCSAAPYTGATCGTVNAEYGVDCTVPDGSACFFVDATNGNALAACATATDACNITGATTSACTASTACSDTDNGTCNGTTYTACSFIVQQGQSDGQRLTLDCSVLGGTCSPDDKTDPQNPAPGGCFVAPGQHCTPGWTICGTGPTDQNAVDCPADTTTCPTGGEGEGEGEGGQ